MKTFKAIRIIEILEWGRCAFNFDLTDESDRALFACSILSRIDFAKAQMIVSRE
jgi:hypothetical protein